MNEVPEWLKEYVDKWAYRLGVRPGWNIEVFVRTPEEMKDFTGSASPDASTKQITHLNKAKLHFRDGIKNDREGQLTVIHELLHVLHSRVDTAVSDQIIPELNSAVKDMAEKVYGEVNESFVEALAVSLWCHAG